ncbi:hypothetical protein BC940DRAFT_323482 [Gongronella butleri]|nr:hypothetical protein BC940DRAFT_323482 [Gongronella butleri]
MPSVSSSSSSYQHAPFAFEDTDMPENGINAAKKPPIPCLPPVSGLAEPLNDESNSAATQLHRSASLYSAASDQTHHQVGQLLLGTCIDEDPHDVAKEWPEWHAMASSSIILSPMQSAIEPSARFELEQAESVLDSTTVHVRRVLEECTWMLAQMDARSTTTQAAGWLEWGYMSLRRLLQQAKQLLHRFDRAAGMRDQLFALERQHWDHSTDGLRQLVHQFKTIVYQGLVACHGGLASVVANDAYWVEYDDPEHAYDAETGGNHNDMLLDDELADDNDDMALAVDHRDASAAWFQDAFVGAPYMTLMGYVDAQQHLHQPVVLTMRWVDAMGAYQCILRHAGLTHDCRDWLHTQAMPHTREWRHAITAMHHWHLQSPQHLTEIYHKHMVHGDIERDLILLDQDLILTRFKVGMLYIPDGQYNEEQWFSNKHHPASFAEFLECLGTKVALKGYDGWAAGLDTKNNASGDYTYRTSLDDKFEVVYHVATLMPLASGDKQYIQRKRYIGNDIVCIVFLDGDQAFDPAAIKSQFIHCFIVVHHGQMGGRPFWRVTVTSVKQVPSFGPHKTCQVFFGKEKLRNYVLAKVINAEYAALKSPKFTKPLDRARQGILADVVERGLKMQTNGTFRHMRQLTSDPGQVMSALKTSVSTHRWKDLVYGHDRHTNASSLAPTILQKGLATPSISGSSSCSSADAMSDATIGDG